MRIASRMAVPPRESIFASPRSSSFSSLVNGWSRNASSLKFTTKTSSSRFEALIKAMADASTRRRLVRMLPLLSTIRPIDTGTSSRRNFLIGCSTPFSNTRKDFCGRFVTYFPLLSTTVACRTTRRVSARKVAGSSCEFFDCAQSSEAASAAKRPAKARLLNWRIVPLSEKGSQGRHTFRSNKFHKHFSVFPVPFFIDRRIAQNVLVPELDSYFRGHVRQFVQVLDRKVTAPSLFGQFVEKPRSAHLFRGTASRHHRLENSDRIDLDVRF